MIKNTKQLMTRLGVETFRKPKFSPEDRVFRNQFVTHGRNAKEWLRKCALLLPEIERRQIWKKRGCVSLYEYAAKLAGMSRNSVDDALRVLRKIEDKHALKELAKERGLNAVRPVAVIATAETADFWAGKAREMSKNTLEMYVREYKKQEDLDLESRTSTAVRSENLFNLPVKSETKIVTMELDPKIAAELEKLKGRGNWNELMREFLELRKQKLEQEKPESAQTESRYIPEKIRRFAEAKTRGQCAYPGCIKPYKILHHTQRWALKKYHDPDKLIPLCKAHERLAHHGLVENEDQQTENWRILKEPVWWDIKQIVDKAVCAHRQKTKQENKFW
ncbi:hypothetical protein HZC21_03470 [Candidatus Peregrinibacteria bacterium]|nr:hypothetical protein [Candidatus Peregrinibacteria bacterium]